MVDDRYNALQIRDDSLFEDRGNIDPAVIIQHSWKKLRGIWKGLNQHYKESLGRFTLSGTHESDFYAFCKGKLDVYYLWKLLQ